jgi:RNA polymerase sigma-70 factor, ECF subfamily
VAPHSLASAIAPQGVPPPAPVILGATQGPNLGGEPIRQNDFDEIYECNFDFVWKTLRRLGVDESAVDDAAHDVFLVVHRQLALFDGRNPKSWLFAIAQRVAWHYRRAVARRRTDPLRDDDVQVDATAHPDQSQERREALAVVQHLLDGLPDDRRAVFILSELEQMSMPEIAKVLSIPLNTAYSRLRLARRDFSRRLRQYDEANQRSAR